MIAGLKQGINERGAVFAEDGTCTPSRSNEHRARMGRELRTSRQAPDHFVHIRDPDQYGFFFRFPAKLFQLPHGGFLILPGKEHGIIEIKTERTVARRCVIGAVGKMDIVSDVSGTLPLIYVEAGRGGQQNGRFQEIEFGKGLVSFPDKLCMQMGIRAFQGRIVRRSSHVTYIKRTRIQFPDNRLKGLPIPPVIRKNDKRYGVVIGVRLPSAGKQKLQFYEYPFENKTCHADGTDQNRKEHAPCAGIDIQPHVLRILLSANLQEDARKRCDMR